MDEEVGIKAVRLLNRLGYEVVHSKPRGQRPPPKFPRVSCAMRKSLAIRNVELLKVHCQLWKVA